MFIGGWKVGQAVGRAEYSYNEIAFCGYHRKDGRKGGRLDGQSDGRTANGRWDGQSRDASIFQWTLLWLWPNQR